MTPLSDLQDAQLIRRERPTMRQVAALAGVGIKTVSRVINGEPNVSSATTTRVLDAVRALDYRPDIHAGNLRRSGHRTRTIGLLVGSVANPFSGVIHRAIEDAAAARGTAVIAASLDDDPQRERGAVDSLLQRRVDGLVLTTIAKSQSYLGAEQERGTQLVFVDRQPSGILADSVVSDNADGASVATAHLIGQGHSRVAFLGDNHEIYTARERKRGFLEELGRAGLPVSDAPVIDDLTDERAAHDAVRSLLESPAPPTAVFSSQNLLTIGAVRGLRELGVQHEVALVGFDDIALADLLEPAITVVAQDPRRIGELAAERLFARLDGDLEPERTYTVPTELIIRGSGEIHARG
jgi:LacI family transcriptional regulator